MMKSVFLCENKDTVYRVYSECLIKKLKETAGLADKVFSKSDLANTDFSTTEYIFSTWDMPVLDEQEIISNFPNLKCVFYAAGSVRFFAEPFLKCGVKVFSAWAANAVPVAEYTTAQIVLANKGFFRMNGISDRKEYYEKMDVFREFKGNYGENIGIIGAGMIGKLVIKMLKNYNLNIYVYDPFLSDSAAEELGVEKCDLEDIFANCSVVSNHLANNSQTVGMLNFDLFKRMKPNATFLNTGRGAQVVEPDLIKILKERHDLTAILDVTFPEPPENGSELYNLSNCILTPHIAGSSGDEVHRMAEYMYNEYLLFLNGDQCKYQVTQQMLLTMA